MKKLSLPQVTFAVIDCVDIDRVSFPFQICDHYCEFAHKKLITSLPVDLKNFPLKTDVVQIEKINSSIDYSQFIIKELNDYVDTDFVLIAQHDGYILNPEAWTDEFLKYDYIGAPWWYDDNYNVGNGGFSLRSKKLLDILQHDNLIKVTDNEDHCICRIYGQYLRDLGIRFAPEALAASFSIEGGLGRGIKKKYGDVWDGEFGFHGFKKTDISKWREP